MDGTQEMEFFYTVRDPDDELYGETTITMPIDKKIFDFGASIADANGFPNCKATVFPSEAPNLKAFPRADKLSDYVGKNGTKEAPFYIHLRQKPERALQPPAAKKARVNGYLASARKRLLTVGTVATAFQGLLDRESSLSDLRAGLCLVSSCRGVRGTDKNEVPLLTIAAPSKFGKTEFLRYVFNQCCTFSPTTHESGNIASSLLQSINQASPRDVRNINSLLVLFASFNQDSPYSRAEGGIVPATIMRLARSYEGRTDVYGAEYDSLTDWSQLLAAFAKDDETGIIVCVDELSALRAGHMEEYKELMDSLLAFSLHRIKSGNFFAVVGSSLHVYDFGEVVLQESGRAIAPIYFPKVHKQMEVATREMVLASEVFSGPSSDDADSNFRLEVALRVAQSTPSMRNFYDVASSKSFVCVPKIKYQMPSEIRADDVFRIAAETALGEHTSRSVSRNFLISIVDELHGSVKLAPGEGLAFNAGKIIRDWKNLTVNYSLPLWRLLQFDFPRGGQLFSPVQDWVLVALYRLFYDQEPSEAVKAWELATVGLLELRKAIQKVVKNQSPTLKEVVGDKVVLKVDDAMLTRRASDVAAREAFRDLPLATESCGDPCFFYAKNVNEEGVEGIFRSGFQDTEIFFQMKLYTKATAKQVLNWLENADGRAKALGYEEGSYVVQLFVTGMIEENIKDYYDSWPNNSMVFANCAIGCLFQPFGDGLFQALVKSKSRKRC